MTATPTSPRPRLREALVSARRSGDRELAAGLRTAVAAIQNAEAVAPGDVRAGALEASPTGLGATEAERLVLSVGEEQRLVDAEVAELRAAATAYDAHGSADRARQARRVADVVEALR